MGNNRIQHYINYTDRRRRRLGELSTKQRGEMEEELYRKLDEDCGKKLIYKMAQERGEESNEVKTRSVIKDKNGNFVPDRKEVGGIYQGAAEPKEKQRIRTTKCSRKTIEA